MDLVGKYVEEIERIKGVIRPIVDEYYPSKANREIITLYDLITLGVLAHIHFNGIIKHAYVHFIEDLKLFPRIRYNKLMERLDRYEELKVLDFVFEKEGEIKIVDAKPIETKELVRYNRHKKRGESSVVREEESIGYNASKKDSTVDIR